MNKDREDFFRSLRVENNTKNKRNIRNKPSRVRYNVRLAAGLAAALVAVGGLAACKKENKINEVSQPAQATYSTILTNEEKLEDSVKKAEQDFLKKYLKGYNEKYGTEYASYESEICTNSINEGMVFKVDGKLVTPGSYPALVKQQLSEYGTVTSEGGHDKVMQILVNDENGEIKVLGTYNEDLQAMYSGNDLTNFDSKLAEISELGLDKEIVKSMFELELAKGAENEISIKQRLNKYNKAVENAEKGFEIGD